MTKENSDTYYVGIDAGSVSLNCVVINQAKEILYVSPYKRHLGRVEEEILALLDGLYQRFDREYIRAIAFTGNHGQQISSIMGAFYEFDTISQVLGSMFIRRAGRIRPYYRSDTTTVTGRLNFLIPTGPAHRARVHSLISRHSAWLPRSIKRMWIYPRTVPKGY